MRSISAHQIRANLYNQYQNCRQGTRTAIEYVENFHKLGAKTNLAENVHHLIARFVGGLQSDIKEKVELQPLGFLTDTITLVTAIEEMIDSCFKILYSRRKQV